MIPNIIYMCDKELTFIKKYSLNWKKLNPEFEIKLYNDSMCEKFLLNEYSQLHCDIFNFIKDGPIKADFWRVCILFKYGGYYVDADIEPLVPINQFIEKDVDFVVSSSTSFYSLFNPNFIMAQAGNIILKKCIDVYINKFINKHPYTYGFWSIVTIMSHLNVVNTTNIKKNWGIYNSDNIKIQILEEVKGDKNIKTSYALQCNSTYDDHIIYNNIKFLLLQIFEF